MAKFVSKWAIFQKYQVQMQKFGKPHAVTGAIFNLLMKINFGVVKLQRIEEDLKIEVAFILFSKLESSFGRRNILTSVPIWLKSNTPDVQVVSL